MVRLWALAALLSCLAAGARAQDEDDDYLQASIEDVIQSHPCRAPAGGFELREVLFQTEARFIDGPSPSPAERLKLLRRYLESSGSKGSFASYGREIEVSSGKGGWWVEAEDAILKTAQQEVGRNQPTTFYFTFIGCAGSEPVILIDSIETPEEPPDDGSYVV